MDEETALLILRLQAEDVEDIIRSAKGKQREGEVDDFRMALQLYGAEVEGHFLFLSDSSLATSMARANHQDGELISQLTDQEDQATRDRDLARRAEEDEGAVTTEDPEDLAGKPYSSYNVIDEFIEKFANQYMPCLEDNDEPPRSESSKLAASRKQTSKTVIKHPVTLRQCVVCMDRFPPQAIARAPCHHDYCRRCLADLFTRSLADESLFPPRCCRQNIPAEENHFFISWKLVEAYRARKLEMETPNRTYCHQPNCNSFIPPRSITNDIGECPRCRSFTCTTCKKASHQGDCPEDTATNELLRLAEDEGWQRCYACSRVVELRHGCNHISEQMRSLMTSSQKARIIYLMLISSSS